MDYEKYYKNDQDGYYTVHFLNKDKLTIPEIRKIFSPYGNIISVNVTKDEAGFRFVKYETLKDTIRCLESLKDGNIIKILPEKKRMVDKTKRTDNRDSNQQQTAGMGNPFRKPFNNKPLNNESENEFDDFSANYMHGHKPNSNVIKDNEADSAKFDRKFSRRQTSVENESSESTTIDYEKFYRIDKDGAYCVHFVNRKGHTLDEIKEQFSAHGNVLSVHCKGTPNSTLYGLRFVRYKTQEEVIKCLEGFKNSAIKILLQKEHIVSETKTTDQKSSSQQQAARTEDTSQELISNHKQFHSNHSTRNERFSGNRDKSPNNAKIWDELEDTNDISDPAFHISRQGRKSNENEMKYKNADSWMSSEKYSRQNFTSENDQERKTASKKQESKFHPSKKTETDVRMVRGMPVNTSSYKIPALVSDTVTKPKEFDVMSDSSLSNETKSFSSNVVFIPMQELIVANIHTSYGVHFILHLFEKHSPISATVIKTIKETNVRFCHVFFKTVQDAEGVEEEFDNFDLSGKNLIVLRKSRMIGVTL